MKVYEFNDELGVCVCARLWFMVPSSYWSFFFFLPLSIKVKKTTDFFFFAPLRAILSYLPFSPSHTRALTTMQTYNVARHASVQWEWKTHEKRKQRLKVLARRLQSGAAAGFLDFWDLLQCFHTKTHRMHDIKTERGWKQITTHKLEVLCCGSGILFKLWTSQELSLLEKFFMYVSLRDASFSQVICCFCDFFFFFFFSNKVIMSTVYNVNKATWCPSVIWVKMYSIFTPSQSYFCSDIMQLYDYAAGREKPAVTAKQSVKSFTGGSLEIKTGFLCLLADSDLWPLSSLPLVCFAPLSVSVTLVQVCLPHPVQQRHVGAM